MTDAAAPPTVQLGHRPALADMARIGGPIMAPEGAELERARGPATTPAQVLADRTGYSSTFLAGFEVPLPTPVGAAAADVLPVGADIGGRLDYMHFSLVMSRARRMAMFVAVNMEGKQSVSINRDSDKWFLDGRIPAEAQWGEELYAGNRLDRGHLVRREDPNWGPDAEVANADTFHFTNCAPQMDVVNQKTWLGLENYILQNARAWKDRATVFTGPVFRESDIEYRGARIPGSFWKVVAFLSDDGRPSATAYLVEQDTELKLLEAAFGAYKTYQRSIKAIEALSGLRFGDLAQYDGFSNEEDAAGVSIRAELKTLDDVRV